MTTGLRSDRLAQAVPDSFATTNNARLKKLESLTRLGMPSHGISEVVRQAVDAPYSNPRDVTPDALTKLVNEAIEGARPDEQY